MATEISWKERQFKLHEQIDKLPDSERKMVRDEQRVINAAFNEVNDDFFGDKVFAIDQFLITHGIYGGDRERLSTIISITKPGKTFCFDTKSGSKSFYKTLDDKVMAADDYIYTLEKSLMFKNSYEYLCTLLSTGDIFKMLIYKIKTNLIGVRHAKK